MGLLRFHVASRELNKLQPNDVRNAKRHFPRVIDSHTSHIVTCFGCCMGRLERYPNNWVFDLSSANPNARDVEKVDSLETR